LGPLLFLFWIVLNGKFTVEIILVGAAVSAALTCFTRKIFPDTPRLTWNVLRHLPNGFGYLVYLVIQVIYSNLQVIRLILKPGVGHPKLVWFSTGLRYDLSRLALANSITLTPGTVTASLGKNIICVYALRPEFSQGLKESGFAKRLKQMEEKPNA
jgi:multicomponent Na+:H+ antiporter subunit E